MKNLGYLSECFKAGTFFYNNEKEDPATVVEIILERLFQPASCSENKIPRNSLRA